MRTGNGSKALLIELLIVLLFFMIAATVLLQLFSTARNMSERAELLAEATNEVQNLAEQLYAASDPQQTLQDLGFAEDSGLWQREDTRWTLRIQMDPEETEAGLLRRGEITVLSGEETLLALPWTRYEEEAAA